MAPPPGIVEVRCAGCEETLEVEHGLTEFGCPDCGMAQELPPELMPRRPRRALPLPGRGSPFAATPSRVPCGGCGAVLSVPHGHGHFSCPLCGTELAASPAATVSVIAPPAAVPITPSRLKHPSEVRAGPSSQSIHPGQILNPIRSEQKHGQYPRRSLREESFSSFRADTETEIPVIRRLQNGHVNPSSHRENSHTEYVFAAGTESFCARKVQEEHPNQDFHASEAQGMPSKSTIHKDKVEGFPNDTATSYSKQKTGYMVPSTTENEQIKSLNHVDNIQQAGEIPSNSAHADQAQLDFATRATANKKSSKNGKGIQKRKNKIVINSSSELLHLRRSKRLLKGSPDLVSSEPIQELDASTNQSQSEVPCAERTEGDPDSSSPVRYQFPRGGSNELDDVDTTTPPPSNHDAPQANQLRNIQVHSPETRWALPVPSSNSWHDHGMALEKFNGVDQPNRDHEEVPLSYSNTLLLQQRPPSPRHMQEAPCGDVLPGSANNPSKKRRGRAPEKLMEPRKEADRPIVTPSGTESWSVHPPCPKVANTLSLLIKQNYPGTYFSVDTSKNGQPCEHVIYHWHQCPHSTRSTILAEFLKRYKWSPGQEEECQKIFDRKAVRQLFNLFCYEKQRARQQLAAKKAKKSWVVHRACAMEVEDCREDSEAHQGDELTVPEHEDPLKWKPFVPSWMKPKWWEMLCDHWATDGVMKVSYQKRKNRSSGKKNQNSGKRPCETAASCTIPLHQQQGMDNAEKLGCDINSPTKTPGGNGVSIDQKACETEGQVRSWNRGRYCSVVGIPKKVQNESVSKSSPGCVTKQGQQPMFTKQQVKVMINQALQGLNEVWEQKFLSLEHKMPGASSSYVVPDGAKLGVAKKKQCQLSREDTLDYVDGENSASARDDGDNHDEDEEGHSG